MPWRKEVLSPRWNTLLFMKGRNRQATKISITIPVYCTVEHGSFGGGMGKCSQARQTGAGHALFNQVQSLTFCCWFNFRICMLSDTKKGFSCFNSSLPHSFIAHESTLTLYRKLRLVFVRNPELKKIPSGKPFPNHNVRSSQGYIIPLGQVTFAKKLAKLLYNS